MGMLREGGDFPDSGSGLERPVAAPTLRFENLRGENTPHLYRARKTAPPTGT